MGAQRKLDGALKDSALFELSKAVLAKGDLILAANAMDLQGLPPTTTPAFRDRLTLNQKRIEDMALSLRQVAELDDPVGEIVEQRTLDNGLKVRRVRAPLGVLFMIFEARPNVILEAFSLAFKAGNVILLRGGSESSRTSAVIYEMMRTCLAACGVSPDCFHGLEDYDRALVTHLLKRKDIIDIVIPRGGDRLIEMVQAQAAMPIIKNDRGLCHTFVDASADLTMAIAIVKNAKTQRPGVCNSLETVLVHESVGQKLLPALYQETDDCGLIWHVDSSSQAILKNKPRVQLATSADWDTEYLDLIMNCRIVANLEEAIGHIQRHGSGHSEVIVTESAAHARIFQQEVDAAAVYWNASSRFTDGFALGLGGELGISTQKLHVRGPVGLKELTTPRWIIDGNGQIRE